MDKYQKINRKIDLIINKASKYLSSFSKDQIKEKIEKAYFYARDSHEGQFRLSGDPYILHPVEATLVLLKFLPDIYTIQACLLHDVIEDTDKTYDDIKNDFGDDVAFLCAGMEKLSKVKYRGEDRNIGSLRKMFIAMAEDLRVVFIKLSDRLHNMKTLSYHPKKDKRDRIALETLNIYAPIADRLGLYFMKNELEEECFKILNYDDYRKLKRELKELSGNMVFFIKNAEKEIESLLKGEVDNFEIDYRIKSIYSIYKKMKKKGLNSIKNLHDLFGIRIIVSDVSDCYKVLGIIHNKYKPIPNRFKDYIALPKPNGYKSLHTTIIGLLKDDLQQPAEIQIKTYEMKEYADIGVAAHFEYKENGSKVAKDIDWVRELKELTESLENNEFMDSLKIDVFKDRIFVFTPKGDSINLPYGSTSIDFAYYLHTDLGNSIAIANVNGKVYPLDKELHNGDVIEIIIDKNRKPNPFWLSFVKTAKAKNRIKAYLKREDKEQHIERGKEMMSKYLLKSGLSILDKDLTILKNLDGRTYNYEERLSLLEQVGNFSITPSSLLKRIFKVNNNLLAQGKIKSDKKETKGILLKEYPKKDIIIGGEGGLDYKFCHCCRRSLPDKIVAHINSKGNITIHKRECKILLGVNKDRLISAYVKGKETKSIFVNLKIIVKNDIGILKDLTDVIYGMDISIDEINSNKVDFERNEISLKLEVLDYDYLIIDRLVERIKLHLGERLVSSSIDKIGDK